MNKENSRNNTIQNNQYKSTADKFKLSVSKQLKGRKVELLNVIVNKDSTGKQIIFNYSIDSSLKISIILNLGVGTLIHEYVYYSVNGEAKKEEFYSLDSAAEFIKNLE